MLEITLERLGDLSKVVLNYRKNFVESCTTNFMMQTAVMGAKYRSGFRSIYNFVDRWYTRPKIR